MLIQQTQSQIAQMKRAERMASAKSASKGEIDEAAQEFETVFLSQMLQHMFVDVDMNPMSEGDSPGEDIYKSMLIDEYGKILSRAGGVGIADHVRREMLKMQEVQPAY